MAKILMVGDSKIGKSTLSDAVKSKIKEKPHPLKKEVHKAVPMTREMFKTDDEWNAFLNFTRPIPLKKAPQMPFKTLGEYLKEYNLIMKKQSQLNASQRILVKNVIHLEVRKGTITLTIE